MKENNALDEIYLNLLRLFVKAKWPNKIVIIRHGESELNKYYKDLEEGFSVKSLEQISQTRDQDIELTKIGLSQANQTGIYLCKERFDVCFTSPYKRTVQTAESIISQFNYPVKYFKDIRLREKEFGRLYGLSKQEIKEKYPEEYRFRELEGKFYYRLLGGENYPDVANRVHSFMDKLTRDYGGKNVLIVTHEIVYKLFRYWFEHLDEEGLLNLKTVPNCGIQTYEISFSKKIPEGKMRLTNYNETGYKPQET